MTRWATALALVAGLVLAARGQDEPEDAAGPRLVLEEREVDLGEVVRGRTVEVEVPLENGGDAPLVVRRVETSCGCTVGREPSEPIPPGDEGTLVLEFDSTRRSGPQRVRVEVTTNDPTQSDKGRFVTVLRLSGEVRTNYRVLPGGAFFGELVRGVEAQAREVRILGVDAARDGFEARLEGELPDYLEAELEPLEEADREGVRLRVRLLPHAPPGELHRVIEVATDVAEQPRVRVPVVAIVEGRVAAPDRVDFPSVRRGAEPRRRVPLERRDGREGIPVRSLDYDSRYLDVSLEEVSGQRLDLLVRLRATAPIGPFAGLVRVRLDVPEQPRLEVPVYGRVLPRLTVDPPALLVGRDTGAVSRTLRVRGGAVTGVETRPRDLDVSSRIVEVDPDASYRVELELAEGEDRAGALVLTTDVPGEERVRVPVVRR